MYGFHQTSNATLEKECVCVCVSCLATTLSRVVLFRIVCFPRTYKFCQNCFVRCTALTVVNLGAFASVTSIGDYFLYCCSALTVVDLSAFTLVTSVGSDLLNGCTALTEVLLCLEEGEGNNQET